MRQALSEPLQFFLEYYSIRVIRSNATPPTFFERRGEWRRGRMDFLWNMLRSLRISLKPAKRVKMQRSKKKGVGVIGLHQIRHCRNWLSLNALNAANCATSNGWSRPCLSASIGARILQNSGTLDRGHLRTFNKPSSTVAFAHQ